MAAAVRPKIQCCYPHSILDSFHETLSNLLPFWTSCYLQWGNDEGYYSLFINIANTKEIYILISNKIKVNGDTCMPLGVLSKISS